MDQRREAGWASEEASWRSSLYRLYGSCPERRPRPLPRCSLAQLAEAAFFPGAGACRVSGQRRRGRESERERESKRRWIHWIRECSGRGGEDERVDGRTDGRRGGRRPAGAVAPPYRFPRRRRRRTPLRETHTETELRERREGRGRATDADDGRGRRRDT